MKLSPFYRFSRQASEEESLQCRTLRCPCLGPSLAAGVRQAPSSPPRTTPRAPPPWLASWPPGTSPPPPPPPASPPDWSRSPARPRPAGRTRSDCSASATLSRAYTTHCRQNITNSNLELQWYCNKPDCEWTSRVLKLYWDQKVRAWLNVLTSNIGLQESLKILKK